eukprot:TRINITY_DN13578_c1_g2_i1.p1 TRINITY_DN13578_c1_g2~~TRINITY_DN13578_c1_g2_i1.p1  ORF type:complete len:452 (+),score=95.42 TRINITY_DN13578_c1_g2_i1:124-1356(+)
MASPKLGTRLALITKSDCRYEGMLCGFDPEQNTVTLENVRMFGPEGFVVFKGSDIVDLVAFKDPEAAPPPDAAIASAEDCAPGQASAGSCERAAPETPVRALRALDEAGALIEELRDKVWELSQDTADASGASELPSDWWDGLNEFKPHSDPGTEPGDSRFCENCRPPGESGRTRRAAAAGPPAAPLPPELPPLLPELPSLPVLPAPPERRPRLCIARASVPPELLWMVEDCIESPVPATPPVALPDSEGSGAVPPEAPTPPGWPLPDLAGLPSHPQLLGHSEGGAAALSPGPLWGSPASPKASAGGRSEGAGGDAQRGLRRERLEAALRELVSKHFGPAAGEAQSAEGAGGGPAARALAIAAAGDPDCTPQRASSASPPAPRWGSATRQSQAAGAAALRRGRSRADDCS